MTFDELNLGLLGVGFGIGLLLALSTWLRGQRSQSQLRAEIATLQKHLNTHLSIYAKGNEEMKQEIEKLKRENENLRITLATLSTKPDRAELKLLHTWDKAIRTLTLNSPAFAPAWEMAVTEAQKEIAETDVGLRSLVRKVFSLLPQEPTSPSS